MAAEEVPLPDEMSPNPPEALARNIMEGLPQPKASPFDFITKLFAKKEKELPTSIDRGGDRGGSQTKFPHVNRGAQAGGDGGGMNMDAPRKEMAMPTGKQKDEDHSGTSNRLRALAKGPVEGREAQSTTRSLGEKLGFAAPPGGSLTDDQPLTLAESIRRKISEKPPEAEEEEMAMAPPVPPQPAAVDDSWSSPANAPGRPPANMASPPNITGNRPQPAQISSTGQPEGQTVLGSWGKPSPIESSNSWGGQQSGAAQSMSQDDWNFEANANPGAPQQQMAPQARGGSIDPFAAPGQATSNPNMQAPSADSWGGWNDASAPKGASAGEGDSDWGPPPAGGAWDEPAAAAPPSNSWGGTPTPKPAVPAQPQSQAQFVSSSLMETGMIKLGDLGMPTAQQQPQPGGPAGAPQQGGAPAFPQQAQAAGTAPDTSSAWGAAPQNPAGPQGGAADPWGSSSTDSWGPATSQNAWGTNSSPENQIPAGASNQWGQPAGQPAQPADPFGGGSAPVQAGDWGEPAGSPTDSWSGGAPAGQGNWNQPSMPGGSWDQPGPEGNAQPAWGDGNDWAQAAQPQQAPQAMPEPQQSSSQAAALGKGRQQAWSLEAEQVETGTWRAFAPSGETLSSGAAAQARAPETPGPNQQSFAPQQDEQSRWDIPIQERMKQSGASMPPLPQTPSAPPSPFAQPAFNQAQAAAAAAPVTPPLPQPIKPQEPLLPSDSPAPTKSGWNFPVYEAPDQLTAIPAEPKVSGSWDSPVSQPSQPASSSLGGSWGEPPAPPTPMEQPKVSGAWDMPSAPSFSQVSPPTPVQQPLAPMPGQPGASVPIDSIMDRLGNVLSNNAEAPAAQAASQWDVSIQERQQQQAAAAAAAAAATPQAASPWGQVPEPVAPPVMPGNGASVGGWGAPPQPLPAPAQAPQAPTPVGNNPWDAPPAPLTPPPNPFALPQQVQQAPAASGWDSPMGQNPGWDSPMGQNPMSSPMGVPAQPVPMPMPLPVPQPAVAAQVGAPAAPAGGLFQNLDDNAIDRLFSENLGVSDAGAAAAAAPVQQAPAPAFTAPRWNPGENGGGTPAQPSFGAPPQPFGTSPAVAADAGGPKISAITPRTATPPEPPPLPGMDRRNAAPFATPGTAPQSMAPPQPMASPFAQPEPVPVAAVAAPSQKNGLFDLDDSAMDELFSKNLGVNEQATPSNQQGQPQAAAPVFQSPPVMAQQQPPTPPANPFSRPAPQMAPSMPNPFAPLSTPPAQPAPAQQQPAQPAWGQQPPAPPTMQQPPQQGGLFSIDDSMIDKIFADNAAPQPPQPVAAPQFNVNEAVKEFAEVAQNVPPPKIAGVGRLDSRTDNTADTGSGRIASIGKFLLDQKDLEKIGKLTGSDLSETKMRILTMEAAQELQTLLQHIGTQETVIGSVIVGHDGLLIANTMPPDIDAESMGVWALGLYMSTEMVIKKMGQDRVHQIVSRTPKGYVVIADFGGGLLVTVSDGKDTDTLIPLMRSITQLVAQ